MSLKEHRSHPSVLLDLREADHRARWPINKSSTICRLYEVDINYGVRKKSGYFSPSNHKTPNRSIRQKQLQDSKVSTIALKLHTW